MSLFPADGMIRLGLAAIAKRDGKDERAREFLAHVIGNASAHPTPVLAYARRLEAAWIQRDVFGQVEALAKERKFAEALTVVDQALADGVDIGTRQRLQHSRDHLHASDLVQQANTAMKERRWADARRIFGEVLDSKAAPLFKVQVRRQLEQMDQRGLGKKN